MWFKLSTSRSGAIGEVVWLGCEQQQEIGETTRMHQGNEVIDMAWCRWMWIGLSTSRNGAFGEVVALGFEQQQVIGEATKMHWRNEVIGMLDVGGCDLDCLPQGMGWLEKLYNLNMNNNKLLMLLDTSKNLVVCNQSLCN
jgi:hypothetical protein